MSPQKRFIMLAAAALLVAGATGILLWEAGPSLQEQIAAVEATTGVRIETEHGQDVLPKAWRDPPLNGRARPAKHAQARRFAAITADLFAPYPRNLLASSLKVVYLFDELSFYDVQYGGTAFGDTLYLRVGQPDQGYTTDYLRKLFHHEYSSLLMNQPTFPDAQWKALNPGDFRYNNDPKSMLSLTADAKSAELDVTGFDQGFLAPYARTSLENDFNLFAETAMTDPAKLAAISARHSRIGAKFQLLKQFYESIGVAVPSAPE